MASNIQFKRGTAAALYAANPVLLRGEPGLEIDTNKIKYGNGVTPWRDLPYGNPALEVVDGGEFFAPSVPAVPGVFTPPTLDGLVLWLDASDSDYTHKVNNRLSMWEDLSETRAQFFQSNKANRPSVVNQIAEEDVVTFDGVNDVMLGNFELPEEFTLLVALRRRGSSTNGKLITAYSANGSSELILCGTETGSSVGVSDGEDFYATQPVDDLVPVIYTLQFSADGLSTRLNGLNTQADTLETAVAKTVMTIGGDRVDFSADNFGGDVAEIVMYDRVLTAADLLDAENYMMARWGIVQVSHPLLEGIKAFWPLNEEGGNRIDITDAEVSLMPTGTVGFEAGVIGNAANFTGGANYLTAPADFTLAGAFSVSVWFKPAAVTGSAPQIIQNWAGGMQGQMVLGFGDEFMGEPGEVWAYIRTADDNYRVGAPLAEANRWYHVVLVFNQTGNRLLLYVDGVLADQAVTAGNLMSTSIPLRVGVGEQTTAPNTVAFLVDQLGIWDRALSAADVEMLYNDELGKEDFTADLYGDNVSLLLHMDKPANAVGGAGGGSGTLTNGLLAFWPLNETSGQRLDISGNARHLSDSAGASLAIGTGGATGSVAGKIGNAAEFTGDAGAKVLRLGTPLPAYETPTGSVAAWVKLNSLSEGRVIAGDYYRTPLSLWFEPLDGEFSGKLSGNQISISHPATSGAWYHLVFTYDHATKTGEFFVNGTSVGTQTYSDTYAPVVNAGGFAVGSTGDGYQNHFINGLVDAVGVWDRVLTETEVLELYNNGAGTETLAGNPDTVGPLAPDLLLHFDGANNSATFTDHGKNQLTPVVNGNPAISTTQSKFGGSSGYFDGTGDHLKFESGPWGGWNDSDWTIEFWIWPVSATGYAPLFLCDSSLNLHLFNTGDLYLNNATTGIGGLIVPSALVTDQWQHVAVVRRDGISYLYVNGVVQGSAPVPYSNGAGTTLSISGDTLQAAYFNGYIDELRVVKGHAIYTANFTPPTAPFPDSGAPTDPNFNDVAALLHFDGTNGSTDFVDSSVNQLELTDAGAVISTAQGKFGGASLSTFDGTANFSATPALDLSSSDFTIEFWTRPEVQNVNYPSILGTSSWAVTDAFSIRYSHLGASQQFSVHSYAALPITNDDKYLASGTTYAEQEWYHVAFTREGNTDRLFVDGVLVDSITFNETPNWPDLTADGPFIVGGSWDGGSGRYIGYIDDLRITKGVARYTANFTPPTAPFPDATGGGGGAGPITTFIDSSKHSHELTAVGNAYLNLEDIKYGSGSGEFAGGHCTIPMSPEFAFGTGDFTVEFWGNLTYAANSAVFSIAPESEEAGTYLIGFRNDPNMFGFCYDIPNFTFVSADISAYYGEWAHYAFVRLDGVLKMYVNGTQVGTANTTIDLDGGTQETAVIGRRWVDVDDHYLDGLIDDLRITKGVARYIANFNPPTKAFPDPVLVAPPAPTGDIYAENVTLLLHMDGANGSTTFTDNSYLQNTVTVEGGAVVSTAQSKFGGASGYFNGNDSFLSLPPSALNFGAQDFTVECWVYWSSVPNYANSLLNFNAPGGFSFYWDGGTYAVNKLVVSNRIANQFSETFLPNADEWYHLAVSRQNGTLRVFVNGVQLGQAVSAPENYADENLQIGGSTDGANWSLNGYIDDFRITKGVARYTADFIPPTEAFPNPFVPGVDATLLMHFDGADTSQNLVDSSANEFVVTSGGAAISTDQSKFGGASGDFSTGGATITTSDLGFPDDFTIEGWFFFNTNNVGYQPLMSAYAGGDATGWALVLETNNALHFYGSTGSGWPLICSSTYVPTPSQWVHVAVTRSGQTVRLFADGVQIGTTTSSINVSGGTTVGVGYYQYFPDFPRALNGYIDELRIVKGTAVYTSNFTPPTAPFRATADVTPTDITGCDLWLDSTGDIATSNGAIMTWADKSGNGRTATPADYAPAPIVAAGDGPNGQDVVRFSGDPNVLDVSYQFNLKNSSGFVLVKHSDTMSSLSYGRFLGFQPTNGFDYDQPDGLAFSTNQGNPTGIVLYNNNIGATHAVTLPLPWTLLSYTIDANGLAKLRIDGEEVDSATFTGIAAKAGGNLYIGHGGTLMLPEALQGDIAEISLFDHALGEAALIGLEQGIMKRWFPPPTPPADPETILLLHFDGPVGTPTFVDASPLSQVISSEMGTLITDTQAKFNQSVYFNGSPHRVYTNVSPTLDISGGAYTIEFWVYVESEIPGDGARLFTFEGQNNGNRSGLLLYRNAGQTLWSLAMNRYGIPVGFVADNVLTEDQWAHIALTYNGTVGKLYVNGVDTNAVATHPDWSEQLFPTDSYSVSIGANTPPFSSYLFNGYIDEFRIVKGAAVYTGNFTPPTQPFGAANLLMHFDADTSDNSGNNVSVTNNGVTIDTITTKFGSGSAFFNGSQVNTLTVADSPAFGFGTGDFTIEMFVKQQVGTRNSVISVGTYQDGILWRLSPSVPDSLYLAVSSPDGNWWDWDATASVPLDTWTHIALTRQNGTLRAFIDGVMVLEQAGVTVDLGSSRPLTIGCGAHELQPIDAYHGYIDELRIIKGEAVYTGNFTPPTAPFI